MISKWGGRIFAIASFMNFVAFAFAPASILAPLEGLQFTTNLVFNVLTTSPLFFYSSTNNNDIIIKTPKWNALRPAILGTLLATSGAIIPALTSPTTVPELDVSVIWCLWSLPEWWLFCASIVFVGLLFYLFWTMYVYVNDDGNNKTDNSKPESKLSTSTTQMVLFAIPAASIGAFGVVQAKAISELTVVFIQDFEEHLFSMASFSVLGEFLFWMTLALLTVSLVVWLRIQHTTAPSLFVPLYILPLLQAAYVVISTVGGGIFFQEFATFTTTQFVFMFVGLGLMTIGPFVILHGIDETNNKHRTRNHTGGNECECYVITPAVQLLTFTYVITMNPTKIQQSTITSAKPCQTLFSNRKSIESMFLLPP